MVTRPRTIPPTLYELRARKEGPWGDFCLSQSLRGGAGDVNPAPQQESRGDVTDQQKARKRGRATTAPTTMPSGS